MKESALVTGGAGFIGSHLVDLLVSLDYKVTIVDNLSTGSLLNIEHHVGSIDFIEEDMSCTGAWQKAVRDNKYIFHLAGLASIVPSIEDPSSYYRSNVMATVNLLDSCDQHLSKLVYSASASCYGKNPPLPTKETAPISTEYPYAHTKYVAEEICMHWFKVYRTPVVSDRFFNVYGPRSRSGDSYGAVLTTFLGQHLNGLPLTVVGDGNQTRDFTFVSDICQGLYKSALHGKPGSVYNLGSGMPRSVLDMANLISSNIIFIPERPGEPQATFADISKAETILGYRPVVNLEDGIELVKAKTDNSSNIKGWSEADIMAATSAWFKHLS